MTGSSRLSSFLKNVLLLVAIVGAFSVAIGVLSLLRTSACDRLDAERIAHLEPGHDVPGPGSVNVIGVGPGPPKSEIIEYLEAESAMMQAGCEVPARVQPT